MADEGSNIENNFNYNYLLVQTILKMRDAEAEKRIAQYWTYFEYALGLVISHLDFQLRGEIQQDYAILQAAIRKVWSSKLHDQSKETYINRLKEDFADAHRFYVMQALNRVGIVRVEDEGIIDFESTDLDTFTKVVRDTSNTGAVGALKAQEGKQTPPLVKPEMVLVYRDKKILSMPKEDYLKLQQDNAQQEAAPVAMGQMPDDPDSEIEDEEGEPVEEDQGEAPIETTEEAADGPSKKWNPTKRY